jgi:hypothetical protein
MANMPNSQERNYIHAIHTMIYNSDGISKKCHICWFEKTNSHVIILNFNIETQLTVAFILV